MMSSGYGPVPTVEFLNKGIPLFSYKAAGVVSLTTAHVLVGRLMDAFDWHGSRGGECISD